MNIKEINKYLLNHYYKKDCKVYCESKLVDNKIYLSDLYAIFILNSDDCLLELTRLKSVNLSNFTNGLDGYSDAIISNQIIKDGKFNLVKIEMIDSDKSCYINERYIKLLNNCNVKIKDNISPVLFYLNDELVGFVLPVKVF